MFTRLLTILTLSCFVTQAALAAYAHEKEMTKIEAFWEKEFLNPNNYTSNEEGKPRPMTKGFWNALMKNPVNLKYFTVCAAYDYFRANFKTVQPDFEKKFGTIDHAQKVKIRGMLADSIYNLSDDARKKMIGSPGSLQNFFKIKLNAMLERSKL